MIRPRQSMARRPRTGLTLGVALLLSGCAAGSGSILKDGLELEQAGRYEEAVSYYNAVLASGDVPASQVSPRLQAATQGLAASRADQGQRALTSGQIDQAVSLAGEAWRLAPDHPRVRALLKAVSDVQMERAAALTANHRTFEAVEVLDRLLTALPDNRQARETRDDLAQELSAGLEKTIRTYDQQGLAANAFLAWLSFEVLHAGDPAVTDETRHRRDALLQRYQVPVTLEVSGRGALTQAVAGALGDVRLKSPLLTLRAGPRVQDGLHLTLSRIDEDFTQQVEPATAVKAVPSGKRRVPNPERAKAQGEIDRLEQEIHGLEDRIDRLHAQAIRVKNLNDKNRIDGEVTRLEREFHRLSTAYVEATDRMQSLEPEVEIDDFKEVHYPVDRYRRAAVLAFHLQAQCSRADLPLKVDMDLSAKAETTDDVHPAYLEYNIPARSLQFSRSDVVLRREALADLARVVGATADTLMNDILVLELRKGRDLAKAGKLDEAAESFVRVVLGTNGDPAPEVAELLRQKGGASVARVRGEVRQEAEAKRVKP